MSKSKTKPSMASVQQIARRESGLGSAIRQAEAFIELNQRIQPALPADVRESIRVACIEGDCLVIAAASSVWATRARMLAEDMLAAANQLWPQPLKTTRVIVAEALGPVNSY